MTLPSPQTVTQFAAAALGISDFPPLEPRKGDRYGRSELCWLCGGSTGGIGWPQTAAIAPTFTQHNTAKRNDSDSVCQSCAALTQAATFQAMVQRRGLPIKIWTQAGWHSYSHFICDDGTYEAPVPSRMREILLDPPHGRWILTLNTTGKKHTIFRASIATGRDYYPVQVDEETVWCSRENFTECLNAFERLTALGCGKDGIETGDYHPADTMRAGLRAWREAENAFAPWRENDPSLVSLVRVCSKSSKAMADEQPAPLSNEPQGLLL